MTDAAWPKTPLFSALFAPSYKHCYSSSRLIQWTTKGKLDDLQNESIERPKYSITIRRSLLRRETQGTWKTSQSWIQSNTKSFVVSDIRECFIEMTDAAWPKTPLFSALFAPSYKHCYSSSRLIQWTTKGKLDDLQNESIERPKYSITIRRSLLRRETQGTWKTSQSWIKWNTQSFLVSDKRESFTEMTDVVWPKDRFVFHPLKPLMHDSALGDT